MSGWLSKLETWIRKQPVGVCGGGSHPGLEMLRKALDEQATRTDEAWAGRCSAAEARGFERAREKAARLVAGYSTYDMTYDEKRGARIAQDDIETAIRAMKDETP